MNGKGNKPSHGVNWKKYYQNNPFPSKLDQKQDTPMDGRECLRKDLPELSEYFPPNQKSGDPMTFWGLATEEEFKED